MGGASSVPRGRKAGESEMKQKTKFAVVTKSIERFNAISGCFAHEDVQLRRFDDDLQLTRELHREECGAVLYDADAGLEPRRPLFAWRACQGERRVPLLVFGRFADRDALTAAFDAGADDVVGYPFDIDELVVRTQHLIRRGGHVPPDGRITCGPYQLDQRVGMVWLRGAPLSLTAREFAIAWLLFSKAGEYVSRRQIAGAVWGCDESLVDRTLGQHVYKLRKKLGLDAASAGVQLRTVYGRGYRVEEAVPMPRAGHTVDVIGADGAPQEASNGAACTAAA